MTKKYDIEYQFLKREIVDSTNTWAKQLAKDGAKEGTVCVAEAQTAGRGRRGRSWDSPSGDSVYMSLVLRPQIRPEQASMLTLVMGLSVAQVCAEQYQMDAMIKWPNDIVLGGKKICGILTEMDVMPDGNWSVIIGTGINVSQTYFPQEIADIATSMELETGKKIKKEIVILEVLDAFARNYQLFLETGDLQNLMEAYNQILVNREKDIRVLEPMGEYHAVSGGINEKGELLVRKEDGTCTAVYAGEVSVRGVYGYV